MFDCHFFFTVVKGVHSSFPALFNVGGDGWDEEQESENGTEKEDQKTDTNGFDWGITSLLMEVSQKTITPLKELYDWAVTEFFYYASYLYEQNRKQIAEMKKISRRNR